MAVAIPIDELARVPALITLAAGYAHTRESALRLLAEFGHSERALHTVEDFGFAVSSTNQFRLNDDLRGRILTSAPFERPESWMQVHEYLFDAAANRYEWLPNYQRSGAGIAYHATELNPEVGIQGYRSLANIDSVALSVISMRLADEQIQRGLLTNTDTWILYLRAMTYYRMGMVVEAVDLLRRVVAVGAPNRETAVAQHLVGHWDCLRSHKGDPEAARQMLSASHKLAAKLGDEAHLAHVKHTMALCMVKQRPQSRDAAARLLRQSLELARKNADIWGEAKILHSLGQVLSGTSEGHAALQRSLEIGQRLGYPSHVSQVQASLDSETRKRSKSHRRKGR